MKKKEIHPELMEFKELLMKFNKKKSNVHKLIIHLFMPKNFLFSEPAKMFDLEGTQKAEFCKRVEPLVKVTPHLNSILKKSVRCQDYEKQVNGLIKSMERLPEDYRQSIFNDIKSFADNVTSKQVTDKARTLAMADNINLISDIDKMVIEYNSEKSNNEQLINFQPGPVPREQPPG